MNFVFPLSVDFAKSRGSYLHDEWSGASYLDLFSGYASMPLGYNHPVFDAQFDREIRQVAHVRMTNNVMSSQPLRAFVDALLPHVFSPYLHFTCTGALAVEAAIKTAMSHAAHAGPKVLCLENAFHGVNCWGFATSRVGVTAARMADYPDIGWLHLALPAAIAHLQCLAEADDLVALVIEPIQATSGDIHLPAAQLRELVGEARRLGICVIMDEIQTGFGVSGTMWYGEQLGIVPDILVFGKKAQVCGICVSPRFAEIFASPYQKLDVTFDGDLLDMIRARYILKAYAEHGLVARAPEVAARFRAALAGAVANFRAAGCLIAFDLPDQVTRDALVAACFADRLLINKAGERAIRLRPNLAISDAEIDSACRILARHLG